MNTILRVLETYFILCFSTGLTFIIIGYKRNKRKETYYNKNHLTLDEMEEYLEIQAQQTNTSSFVVIINSEEDYIFYKALYNLGYSYKKMNNTYSKYMVWNSYTVNKTDIERLIIHENV